VDFHKVETTSNFVFGPEEARTLKLTDHGSDVFRLQGSGKRWPRGTDSFATLTPEEFGATASKAQLTTGPGGEVTLKLGGVTLLESQPGRGLGVCGNKWVLAFPYNPEDRFYGLGEKNLGFELSGKRIEVVNVADDDKADLMQDLVAIIYSFSARMYGLRRAKRKTEHIISTLESHE